MLKTIVCWRGVFYKNLVEVSVKLIFAPKDWVIGFYFTNDNYGKIQFWIYLLPCFPIRIHFKRTYGGTYPGRGMFGQFGGS